MRYFHRIGAYEQMAPRCGLFMRRPEEQSKRAVGAVELVVLIPWGVRREFVVGYGPETVVDRPTRWFRLSWYLPASCTEMAKKKRWRYRWLGAAEFATGVEGRSLL
ncbi:MAG TPA: hypothetical protein PK861_00035 [Thermomonas sp.]|nr:hypothetical protein [Thermomonas sp.]